MKKTFSVTVTEEDGPNALDPYLRALDWKLIAYDLDGWLRNMIKYEEKTSIDPQEVRDKLHELLADDDLVLD